MTRNQFVDALKLFLDTADPGDLDNLALRLKPYRITSLQVQRPDGASSARSIPVIVLDDGRKTSEPTPTLEQHLVSLLAAPEPDSMPMPTLTPSLDSFDVASLPWLSTDPSCLTAPGNTELPFEDMILDDDQLGDVSSEFSMSVAPGYYQDPRMPVTPPYTDFFESATAPLSSLASDHFGPSAFLNTPMATPSPSSDPGDYLNTPTQENTPASSAPATPVSSPQTTSSRTRSQAKINRRRNNNPNRLRKGRTAASTTQAILSSSASTSSSLSRPQPSGSPDPATAALVFSNCIRKDYLDFLRAKLPEWVRDGLWRSSSPLSNSNSHKGTSNNNNRPCFMTLGNPPNTSGPHSRRTGQSSSSTYGFLENIYSWVSQLDSRIETDQVRKRVALVLLHSEYLESYHDWKATRQGLSSSSSSSSSISRNSSSSRSNAALPLPAGIGIGTVKAGVGRGDMTLMIDNILEQTTPGWDDLSPKRKLQLRALFHERKRYGKRWAVFREEVGCALLLVCSGQLGNMVSNTKVTMAALKQIAQAIRDSAPIMEVLNLLEPLAAALVNNDGYRAFVDDQLPARRGGLGCSSISGVGNMIRQFEDLQARRGPFEAGRGWDRVESCSGDEDMD